MLPTMLAVSSAPAPWSYMQESLHSIIALYASPVHDRRRGGVPDRPPDDLGPPLARLGAARSRIALAGRSNEARDAPVDRRARDEHLRGRESAAAPRAEDSHRAVRGGGSRGSGDRRGGHASVLQLDRPGHLSRRAL